MSTQVLRISGLQKYYGAKLILDAVSLNLNRGDRAVLVGENGVGKSTLARLILARDAGENGEIRIAPGTILGYLPQELQVERSISVEEYIREGLGELSALRRRMTALEEELARDGDLAQALEEYGQLQAQYELRGGYTLETRRERIFAGLGLGHVDAARPVMSLSGGEKTRVGLAALLLQEPDLLILDEPTNHLDFAGLAWLEGYLGSYPHALLMITHDRRFINRVATKILDLSAVTRGLTTYYGNYDDYRAQRDAQYQQDVDAYHSQVNRLKALRAQMKKEAHGHRKAKRPDDGDKAIKFAAQQQVARTVSKAVRSARQQLETLEANRLDNPRHVWHIEYDFDPLPLTEYGACAAAIAGHALRQSAAVRRGRRGAAQRRARGFSRAQRRRQDHPAATDRGRAGADLRGRQSDAGRKSRLPRSNQRILRRSAKYRRGPARHPP